MSSYRASRLSKYTLSNSRPPSTTRTCGSRECRRTQSRITIMQDRLRADRTSTTIQESVVSMRPAGALSKGDRDSAPLICTEVLYRVPPYGLYGRSRKASSVPWRLQVKRPINHLKSIGSTAAFSFQGLIEDWAPVYGSAKCLAAGCRRARSLTGQLERSPRGVFGLLRERLIVRLDVLLHQPEGRFRELRVAVSAATGLRK